MKKILLTVFAISFSMIMRAELSLELFYNGNPIPANGTIEVLGDPAAEAIQAVVGVKNVSSKSVDVFAKKIIHEGDTLAGTSNYFCWGLCFPPFVYESPNTVTIDAGVTNNEFYGDYTAYSIPGKSRVTYVFYVDGDVNDSVAVTVVFNASPASVGDLAKSIKFSEAYPNPATSVVNVDYALTTGISRASVVLTNMLGSRVKEIVLTEQTGRIQIPVSELVNGIYFYSLVANDQVILTRKFVVKR